MKRSQLINLIKESYRQIIKQQSYKQKDYAMSTNKDFKDGLQSYVRQAFDNFFTKYYYQRDAVKIIQSLQLQIKQFVNNVISKLDKK